MSHRTKLRKLLNDAGFVLVRKSKHFVYKNGAGLMILLPNHNNMNPRTFKIIQKKILASQTETEEGSR